MKKVFLFSFLFLLSVTLTGCFKIDESDNTNNSNSNPDNQVVDNTNKDMENKDEPKVKKFYPETPNVEKPITTSGSDSSEFVITKDLEAKIYIVDKYDPGICYGAPSPVPSSAIDSMIQNNPGLASFVRAKYSLVSDLDVYNKIKQLNGVRLEEKTSGSYTYYFNDGQCCVLKAYQGNINIVGRTISESVTQTQTKNNPC